MNEASVAAALDPIVTDRLLRGRLVLQQPRKGHRAGTDAVLLAAASGAEPGERFIDVGAGVGTVGLAVGLYQPESQGVLFEADAEMARLARLNIEANGLTGRVAVVEGDLFGDGPEQTPLVRSVHLVLTNPPFFQVGTLRASPHEQRRASHILGTDGSTTPSHGDWIKRTLRFLEPSGRLLMIHRADALPDILGAVAGRLGALIVRPIHPKAGLPAIRVLVGGTSGSRAPLSILPPLVLHQDEGAFTPEANGLHAGEPMPFWTQKSRPRRPAPLLGKVSAQ